MCATYGGCDSFLEASLASAVFVGVAATVRGRVMSDVVEVNIDVIVNSRYVVL